MGKVGTVALLGAGLWAVCTAGAGAGVAHAQAEAQSVPPPAPVAQVSKPAPAPPPSPAPAPSPVQAAAHPSDSVRIRQSPSVFFPGQAEAGERSFLEREAIVELPLRWALSTRLTQPAVFTVGSESVTLPAGELLPMVAIFANGATTDPRFVFCTRSKLGVEQRDAGILVRLMNDLERSLSDGQNCLEDTDKDGTLDHALALGEGSPIADLGAITPIPFTELLNEPIDGTGDFVRIRLDRVARTRVDLRFDIFQRGTEQLFDSVTMGRLFRASKYTSFQYGGDQPMAGNLLGIRFDVIEGDREENRARISWRPVVSPTEYAVAPEVLRVGGY